MSSNPTTAQQNKKIKKRSVVYDKAKFHYGGQYPEGLAKSQAFVHTGLYLGWIMEQKLFSDAFRTESSEAIGQFRRREITGPKVFESWDGSFVENMLSAEGNAFTDAYFNFKKGMYLTDYGRLFGRDVPTIYHVADNWENYDKLKEVLNRRYAEWKKSPTSVSKPIS